MYEADSQAVNAYSLPLNCFAIKMNKHGVSVVIAVVLLIMIVIVAATSAYYWLTNVQGDLQVGVEVAQEDLTEQVIGGVNIEKFEHNSTANNSKIIMQNTGARELKKLGDSEDLIIISNAVHSCTAGFNSTTCDVCPFDFGVGEIKYITLNFTATNCETLRKGQKYDAYFVLGDARIYVSFISDIT